MCDSSSAAGANFGEIPAGAESTMTPLSEVLPVFEFLPDEDLHVPSADPIGHPAERLVAGESAGCATDVEMGALARSSEDLDVHGADPCHATVPIAIHVGD